MTTSRDRAPVFVVGSARSGNTLLYHLLLASARFPVYRTEPAVFDLLVPRFGDFGELERRRALMGCWVRTKQFRRSGLNAEAITDKVLASVNTAGEFLRTVMDDIARAGGFRRWAVWGPDNLLYMPAIKRQIPNALFIHVIRDGRDVACALNRKEFIRPFPWDRKHRLYVSALHWMWKVQTGRRYGAEVGTDYMELSFEDLALHPEKALAKVSAFIGEDLDYDVIRSGKIGTLDVPNTSFGEEWQAGSFSPVGRWQRQLSNCEISQLEGLISGLLAELGYPLSAPVSASGAGAAKATLSLRLRAARALYPRFYRLKEWLKVETPMGRFVNMNRLHLDESDELGRNEEGAKAPASHRVVTAV